MFKTIAILFYYTFFISSITFCQNRNESLEEFEALTYNGCFNNIVLNKKIQIRVNSSGYVYYNEVSKIGSSKDEKENFRFKLNEQEYLELMQKIKKINFSKKENIIFDSCMSSLSVLYKDNLQVIHFEKSVTSINELLLHIINAKNIFVLTLPKTSKKVFN